MGPNALKFFHSLARKGLTKNRGSGITEIADRMAVESEAASMIQTIVDSGLPLERFDQFIRSEADVLKFLNIIKNAKPVSTSETTSGVVLPFKQKRSFAEEIKLMKESGDIVDPNNLKKNDNVLTREMFRDSNLNKPTIEGQMEKITGASNKINQIQKEIDEMYRPKTDAEIKAKFDKQNQESIQRFKDKMKKDEPEDKADGGRIGYYTGGITDVEPSLNDIGHGSDALMARTRLMSPGAQATTSTGLNYLLAEDNDNLRVPFSAGGDPRRRAFLKLLATLTGGAAAFKTGILGLGEGTAKKAVTETVKQSAGSGMPPPYFFKLVDKIKTMGDDVTKKAATKDREVVTRYKDFELTEDVATGEKTIQRIKTDTDVQYYDETLAEDVYMNYKPGKGQADEATPKVADEYVEDTSYLRTSGPQKGEIFDTVDGVPDDVIQEGTMFEDTMTEFGKTKKADGGRIGFSAGGGKFLLSKLGINSTTTRFLEKVFGKEKYKNLIANDPEMHRGLLEVAEMFRSKDKSGLVEYMQNFLPQMSKKELEAFVVGSGDTKGIEGQLIRLGSGRDYKNKLDMIEEANNIRKLKDFDVEDVSKNAEGGRIGFSGGGILRAIIANSAKKKGMSVTDFIKATNYKGLPPEVKMFLSAEDFAKLKSGQKEMYDNYIDMAKTRLEFQKNIEGGKNTPARELFEGMEKTMDEQSFVPKTVTSDDVAEMELMVKNRFNKGRKDNAKGGLQTMLGE